MACKGSLIVKIGHYQNRQTNVKQILLNKSGLFQQNLAATRRVFRRDTVTRRPDPSRGPWVAARMDTPGHELAMAMQKLEETNGKSISTPRFDGHMRYGYGKHWETKGGWFIDLDQTSVLHISSSKFHLGMPLEFDGLTPSRLGST